MNPTRRNFVILAGMAPLALAAGRALAAEAAACYDPASLPLSQKNRRRSLGYVDASLDPKRHCSACAFFTAGQGTCGYCQLLTGGPVNAGAVCNSFAPKAA
jgi:hypothetical protein